MMKIRTLPIWLIVSKESNFCILFFDLDPWTRCSEVFIKIPYGIAKLFTSSSKIAELNKKIESLQPTEKRNVVKAVMGIFQRSQDTQELEKIDILLDVLLTQDISSLSAVQRQQTFEILEDSKKHMTKF